MFHFNDPETCSWCTQEFEWDDLTSTPEGNLCTDCATEYFEDMGYRV